MDETKAQTLIQRLGRIERRLKMLYIFAFVVLIGVVVTVGVWFTRGSGDSKYGIGTSVGGRSQ